MSILFKKTLANIIDFEKPTDELEYIWFTLFGNKLNEIKAALIYGPQEDDKKFNEICEKLQNKIA